MGGDTRSVDHAIRIGLVGRLVSREADVSVLAKDLHVSTELLAELGEQRLHLVSDRFLEEVPARGEVFPAVVVLETEKPRTHLGSKAFKLGHGTIISGAARIGNRLWNFSKAAAGLSNAPTSGSLL